MSSIINISDNVELSKRFYLPGIVIKGKCPKCKTILENDLGENCLSYPQTNKLEEVYFCCNNCDKEFSKQIVIKISVEVL